MLFQKCYLLHVCRFSHLPNMQHLVAAALVLEKGFLTDRWAELEYKCKYLPNCCTISTSTTSTPLFENMYDVLTPWDRHKQTTNRLRPSLSVSERQTLIQRQPSGCDGRAPLSERTYHTAEWRECGAAVDDERTTHEIIFHVISEVQSLRAKRKTTFQLIYLHRTQITLSTVHDILIKPVWSRFDGSSDKLMTNQPSEAENHWDDSFSKV